VCLHEVPCLVLRSVVSRPIIRDGVSNAELSRCSQRSCKRRRRRQEHVSTSANLAASADADRLVYRERPDVVVLESSCGILCLLDYARVRRSWTLQVVYVDILYSFLILGPASQKISSGGNSIQPSVIAAIVILVVAYILSLVVAIACSSWVFQLDILYVPCLTSSLLGLINVLYNLTTHSATPQWTSFAIAAVVLSVVSSLVYIIAALLTFRKIHIVRARDAMHRHAPEPSTDKMMPETELQRQQLLRLLLQQEDAKKPSPDKNQQTFKLDWPGNNDNRRNTMNTIRNLPRAARHAYENRSSASFMVQDPHPQAAMHMDPVTEEESMNPRMAPMSTSAYPPSSGYDDHNIPGIVNTRYQPGTQVQTSTSVPPPLQPNGYPIEKPELQRTNEPPLIERGYNQYHVVDEEDWQRQQVQERRPTSTASRESRRLEIELADRGKVERRRQDLNGVEVFGSIRGVEFDEWGRR